MKIRSALVVTSLVSTALTLPLINGAVLLIHPYDKACEVTVAWFGCIAVISFMTVMVGWKELKEFDEKNKPK